jgi:putative endonuclease
MISRMCDLLRGKPGPDSGAYYENKARRYLARRGVKTLACNYHCRFGEIDLIAMDKQTLLFVEVRYRTAALYGSAVASVTAKKQEKIRLTAKHYLQKHRHGNRMPCRFDVVGIEINDRKLNYRWIKNAF